MNITIRQADFADAEKLARCALDAYKYDTLYRATSACSPDMTPEDSQSLRLYLQKGFMIEMSMSDTRIIKASDTSTGDILGFASVARHNINVHGDWDARALLSLLRLPFGDQDIVVRSYIMTMDMLTRLCEGRRYLWCTFYLCPGQYAFLLTLNRPRTTGRSLNALGMRNRPCTGAGDHDAGGG